jgi:uncharacterized protein YcgI (DUF1989 family)
MTEGLIPARHGKAVRLRAGEAIEVINTHGNQVLDTWAFNADDITEAMSMAHTRSVNSRVYVRAGDRLFTSQRRPILRFVKDTSPGRHDILLCACNQAVYTELGCTRYHRNCHDNLLEALKEHGAVPSAVPSPLNLFMNVRVGTDGEVLRSPPVSKPKDFVQLAAEMDLWIVFSSCPQDITPVNGPALTPSDAHYRILPGV